MKLSDLKQERRDSQITVRLSKNTIDKLKEVVRSLGGRAQGVSQADVIERLIEMAHQELKSSRSKR